MTRLSRHEAAALAVMLAVGCSSSINGLDDNSGDNMLAPDASCQTAITGRVYAPNGTLPLYNVTVYVPAADPGPLPTGVQCGQCQAQLPGGAITQTRTDAQGRFRLEGVPAGQNVPVVITTGKWRRQLTVASVAACADTPVQDGVFRLPRNKTEGDLPRIAVVTGGCDPLGCILSKLGIDRSEFGDSSAGPSSVVFYNGSGGTAPGAPKAAPMLWNDLNELKKFDVVINSCECDEHNENKIAPDVLRQYADIGGRVFGSHYHYTWSKNLIQQWKGTASWTSGSIMDFNKDSMDLVDTSHPDGQALAQWLVAVGASPTPGQVQLSQKTPNASTVVAPTLRWLYGAGPEPATSHYLSFKTPVGTPAPQQCGKVVYAGMHVSSGEVGPTFPSGCSAELSPDEKALVFLLFDLSSCVDIIL